MAKTSSIIRNRLQKNASLLIGSIIDTLYGAINIAKLDEDNKTNTPGIDNEISSRCTKILTSLERYYISAPDIVVENTELVEEIIDAYSLLLLKENWTTNERHWFSVANRFIELSADVVARENALTAMDVLERSTYIGQDNNQQDPE